MSGRANAADNVSAWATLHSVGGICSFNHLSNMVPVMFELAQIIAPFGGVWGMGVSVAYDLIIRLVVCTPWTCSSLVPPIFE